VDEFSRKRGNIVVAGASVAQSRKVDDEYATCAATPSGAVLDLTGYYSFQYGSAGWRTART
jgi:hypothetical protein